MPRRTIYKAGDEVAGWQLAKLLGDGGNGEVWRALRQDSTAAVKFLRQTRTESEAYKRFVNETKVLQQLGVRPGILPLLDLHLPVSPTRKDPAWLSMPIAVSIREALPADAPLITAVQGVRAISATLAELSSTRGLNHRDIKPENLYLHDGQWCIGDFGLVDDPDGETLTEVGQLVGARFYLAPELHRADNSSWSSADLYALAKTLWVLITGQRYPPPGHLVRSVDYFRLRTYIQADDGIRYLESLIERSTNPQPNARPSMMEFSEELSAWLQPRDALPPPAPSDVTRERIRSAVLSSRDLEIERSRLREYVDNRLRSLRTELTQIGSLVQSLTGLVPEYGLFPELQASNYVTQLSHLPDTYYVAATSCRVTTGLKRRSGNVNHVAGIVLCMTTSGVVHMLALHLCMSSPTARVVHVWVQNASAQMESFIEHQTLNELLASLLGNVPAALECFADFIES